MILLLCGLSDTGLSTAAAKLRWSTEGILIESDDEAFQPANLINEDLDEYYQHALNGRTVIIVIKSDDMESITKLSRMISSHVSCICLNTMNVWRSENE